MSLFLKIFKLKYKFSTNIPVNEGPIIKKLFFCKSNYEFPVIFNKFFLFTVIALTHT
jgi:hypothetical protein